MGNGVFKKPEKVHLHTTQITTNFDGPFLLQKRLYYLQKCFGFPQILKSHHRLKKDTIEIPRKTFLMESRDPCNILFEFDIMPTDFKDAI